MKTIITTFLSCLLFFTSQAQTIIPDRTEVSGTWTLANSPYEVQGLMALST